MNEGPEGDDGDDGCGPGREEASTQTDRRRRRQAARPRTLQGSCSHTLLRQGNEAIVLRPRTRPELVDKHSCMLTLTSSQRTGQRRRSDCWRTTCDERHDENRVSVICHALIRRAHSSAGLMSYYKKFSASLELN